MFVFTLSHDIINESIISPVWYFSTSVRPPLTALFPVSVASHRSWLRRNFLYGTARPCIFILTHKHKYSPPTMRQKKQEKA